jgi:hypothetical protein
MFYDRAMRTYERFTTLHSSDPDWIELRESPYFERDLRRALKGDRDGFCELAIYGRSHEQSPRIMRALWKAGVPVRPYRYFIRQQWRVQSSCIIAALGQDLDAFLRDAGFSTARLPEEFDIWRGGDEPHDEMIRGRSWTLSYAAACAFALNCEVWRHARRERWARQAGYAEPLVLTRRVQRDEVAAYIGGVEREVVLTNDAIYAPAYPFGSLPEWRRHRARSRKYMFVS